MGRVVHFEVHAADPARAMAFYETVFGWSFQTWEDHPYWIIITGSPELPGINGGLVPRRGDGPADGAPTNAFVCTLDVESVDDSLALACANGGQLAVAKMPVPGVGWLAYVKDTEGNLFGLMQDDPEAA